MKLWTEQERRVPQEMGVGRYSWKEPQVPPLRSFGAPVGMTILSEGASIPTETLGGTTDLSIPTGGSFPAQPGNHAITIVERTDNAYF
jgi:hypothetical protein